MAGLGPAIHDFLFVKKLVDARTKCGHDAEYGVYGQTTSGGSDIRMASVLPPVFRPKVVPRS